MDGKDFYEAWEELYDRALMAWHDTIVEAWKKLRDKAPL